MEEQGELIPSEELPDAFGGGEPVPWRHATGERVLRDRPDIYKAVVRSLAEMQGVVQIARAWGIHHTTVAAIRDREGGSVDTLKKTIAKGLRHFAQVAVERLNEEVTEMDPHKLAIPIGIALEKAELLEGRPTSIIDHRDTRRLGDMGSIIDAIEVEESGGAGSMGLGAGGKEQKGGLALEGGSVELGPGESGSVDNPSSV